MKLLLIPALVLGLSTSVVSAATTATATAAPAAPVAATAAPATAAATAAANKAAAADAVLRAHEQRVELLRGELKSLDSRIEARVDKIVNALKSISDSKDTRTKVARMKRDTITRLTKTIDYYRNKRASMQEELRRPKWNLTPEQKQKMIAKFDERIEKRVGQIIALQQSLPEEKDYDRYKATGSGWWGNSYELNKDYTQNKQLTSHTNAQRQDIVEGLRASIARLDNLNRTLRAQNAPEAEIAKNDALIAERRNQLAAALKPVETPTRGVGDKEANSLDQALKTAVSELQRDFNTLFGRYNSAIEQVSALNYARAAAAAAKR